jgi:hypothetical protein
MKEKYTLHHICSHLKVDGNEKRRGVRKNTVIQVLYGIVAIEGYLQFECVLSL